MAKFLLPRRSFLKGAGALIALPPLEAMFAKTAYGATAPLRFAGVYFGNGVLFSGAPGSVYNYWECTGSESNWQLSRSLAPLAPYKSDITVIHGVTNDAMLSAIGYADDARHWNASATFLTGQPYDWVNRANLVALQNQGGSIDQKMASMTNTQIKSLVMGGMTTDGLQPEPRGSNQILNHISWQSQNQIETRYDTTYKVFNKLFGGFSPTPQGDEEPPPDFRRSILDVVMLQAKSLEKKLGVADRRKLDQYMSSIRGVEKRIAEEASGTELAAGCLIPSASAYSENNRDSGPAYEGRIRNMTELMVLAFQCDATRVSTFMLGNEHSYLDSSFHEGAGGNSRHHDASHYRTDGTPSQMAAFNYWQVQKLAYLIKRLKETADVDGNTLLDNTMLMYGCGISDGNDHNYTNLPLILVGKAGGKLTPGKLLRLGGAKHSNLLLTLLKKWDPTIAKWGMSDGTVAGI